MFFSPTLYMRLRHTMTPKIPGKMIFFHNMWRNKWFRKWMGGWKKLIFIHEKKGIGMGNHRWFYRKQLNECKKDKYSTFLSESYFTHSYSVLLLLQTISMTRKNMFYSQSLSHRNIIWQHTASCFHVLCKVPTAFV